MILLHDHLSASSSGTALSVAGSGNCALSFVLWNRETKLNSAPSPAEVCAVKCCRAHWLLNGSAKQVRDGGHLTAQRIQNR